jgi:hypothetical protein
MKNKIIKFILEKYLFKIAQKYVKKTSNKYDDQALKFIKDLIKNLGVM